MTYSVPKPSIGTMISAASPTAPTVVGIATEVRNVRVKSEPVQQVDNQNSPIRINFTAGIIQVDVTEGANFETT